MVHYRPSPGADVAWNRRNPKKSLAQTYATGVIFREQETSAKGCLMKNFTAVVERDPDTGLFVGYVPGFPGAHSQGETLDELNRNLREVIGMLLEDGEPRLETEFIGTQTVSA